MIPQTIDTNSPYLAKFCFSLGVQLKRVEVIPDDEEDIMEAVRRMSAKYDFVVTSGGIGPTCVDYFLLHHCLDKFTWLIFLRLGRHDDITYSSIAKAFDLKLQLYQPAFERMKRLSIPHPMQPNFDWDTPSPGLTAKLRMVELPYDETLQWEQQALFVADDMWVPIAVVNGNVHILPGVPRLFERLLDNLKPTVLPRVTDPEGKGTIRFMFSTPLPESAVASFLTELAAKVESRGVKVGSYPRWGKKQNTVTLVGTDREYMNSLVREVEEGVQGKWVSREDEMDPPAYTQHAHRQ